VQCFPESALVVKQTRKRAEFFFLFQTEMYTETTAGLKHSLHINKNPTHPFFPSSLHSFGKPSVSLKVSGDDRQHCRVPNATRWFHAEYITSPPWSATPPHSTHPNILIRHQVGQHVLNCSLTYAVRATSKFTQNAFLARGFQPGRCGC
jgi:hypothetical protein